jgi:hypothetical protein
VTRYIIAIRVPQVRQGLAVDGGTSDVVHVAWPAHTVAQARRCAEDRAVTFGGVVEWVREESHECNIPKLEPEAWARSVANLAESKRRVSA